jgi:hypothetical protein
MPWFVFTYDHKTQAKQKNRGAPPSFRTAPLQALRHAIIPYSAEEKAGLERVAWFDTWGRGYATLQSTRPQTLGYSLADSPVGLLAWMYEKLVEWSDSYPWSDDEGNTFYSHPLVCLID